MQKKKIQEAMKHVYFQKMTKAGYQEITDAITHRHLESRLRYLNKQLQYSEIITPADAKQVDLGTTVTLRFDDDNDVVTYQIVGKQEADLAKQKVSFDSPLGRAIMHQPAGTTVTVQAPQSSYQVTIIEISLG